HHDRVGIPKSQQPGRRPVTRHAVPTRVVDNDQIAPTPLDELGREPYTGARAQDRLSFRDVGVQAVQNLLTGVWVWHCFLRGGTGRYLLLLLLLVLVLERRSSTSTSRSKSRRVIVPPYLTISNSAAAAASAKASSLICRPSSRTGMRGSRALLSASRNA